jgi:hypothetical protein
VEWWTPRQRLINVFLQSKLPQELVDMVQNYLFEPRDRPMSPEEHSSLMNDFKAREELWRRTNGRILDFPKRISGGVIGASLTGKVLGSFD